MKRLVLAAALLASFLSAPALAQTKVGDWEVEKRPKDEHCNATRAFKDSDCDQKVIVLTYSKRRSSSSSSTAPGNGARTTRF
jgi:hypothetical protein